MWVTSLGLAGEAGIFASLPFYPMFSGVPNGPLRLSPPQVHAAVHNSDEGVSTCLDHTLHVGVGLRTPSHEPTVRHRIDLYGVLKQAVEQQSARS